MSTEEGIPTDQLREHIYFEGIELRNKAQKLLKECRDYRVAVLDAFRKRKIHELSSRYDEIYDKYIRYDAKVSSYCGMASNPWTRNEEGEQVSHNPVSLLVLHVSSIGLTSHRETVAAVLQDVSNQINSLYSESNNKLVNGVALVSLVVALISLFVSLLTIFI